jgi:RNA polymerase sigma factor (sigma-70 family)
MSHRFVNPLRHFLRALAGPPADATDAQLLERFAAQRDAGAFRALVQKYGPMTLGVCRRVLGHEQDAEDAFQAAFLVLARKAAAGFRPRLLGHWLYGVAWRTAQKARVRAARRRAKERQAVRMPSNEPEPAADWADLRPVLDEEINGLPEKYRRPFVLCYLQGKTNEQAAELLGCPKGTVLSRLAWARERLRARLLRRGLAPSVGALAAGLSAERLSATVPEALAERAAEAALSFAWGSVAAQATPDSVPALAEGVLAAMTRTKIVTAVILVMVLGLLGTGVGVASYYLRPVEQPPQKAAAAQAKGGSAERVRKLLEKRREVAREEYGIRLKLWQIGNEKIPTLLGAAMRILDAESALATDRAARVAVSRNHLARMQGIEKICRMALERARGSAADVAMAEFYVLDAEIRLARAEEK